MGQKRQRDERVGGQQIEGDRAIARVIQDAGEGVASRFGERAGKRHVLAGWFGMFADAGAQRRGGLACVLVEPVGQHHQPPLPSHAETRPGVAARASGNRAGSAPAAPGRCSRRGKQGSAGLLLPVSPHPKRS